MFSCCRRPSSPRHDERPKEGSAEKAAMPFEELSRATAAAEAATDVHNVQEEQGQGQHDQHDQQKQQKQEQQEQQAQQEQQQAQQEQHEPVHVSSELPHSTEAAPNNQSNGNVVAGADTSDHQEAQLDNPNGLNASNDASRSELRQEEPATANQCPQDTTASPTTKTATSSSMQMQGVCMAGLNQFLNDLKAEHPQHWQTMTTTDACTELVIPRTGDKQCAYVDIMNPEHVGAATVFVSHAWRYKIADVLGTLLEHAEEEQAKGNPEPFFWFDLFINNQNIAADLPQDWWSTTFKESIKAIGRVVLVLTPWHDPMPVTRAWCLWEIFCSASQEGVELTIRLPSAERQELKAAVMKDADLAVTDTMVRVQAERAEAWNPKDKEMIFKAIEESVGFAHVNKVVKDQMRAWCLTELLRFVQEAEQAAEDDGLRSFALLCNRVGLVLFHFGERARATELYEKGLALEEQALGTYHPDTATSHHNLGQVYFTRGECKRAIACYERSLHITLNTLGEKHPHTAIVCHSLGEAYAELGDYHSAIGNFELCLQLTISTIGEKNPQVCASLHSLGRIYGKVGEYGKAVGYLEKDLEITLETVGEKHPSTAVSYSTLGQVYRDAGHYDKAIELFDKALQIKLDTVGEQNAETVRTLNDLGQAYNSKGEHERAIECLEKGLALALTFMGDTHQDVASLYNSLGLVYGAKGMHDAALEMYEKTLGIELATLGEEHPSVGVSYHNIGHTYRRMGDLANAKKNLAHAVHIWMETLGPDHPHTRTGLNSLIVLDSDSESDDEDEGERECERGEESEGESQVPLASGENGGDADDSGDSEHQDGGGAGEERDSAREDAEEESEGVEKMDEGAEVITSTSTA
ncbi:hypothetical protein PTSG_10816 [Salpingoeca rosetta]|uniref:Uncharacterized protein n=1 Tax=Salpingoeca rosetta (strain ATCC 50818 / BSB-021) TaxID=946362 RepID=F2UQ03_SALR5|nr:uncharacterized protein PTSG_10816 [Salpingoeca rosetta]EGD79833.1 hypothetical protein PTSG_10816 [Salpingoeca rosetta]|eukprot:XP_004988781.1 hypothetical protein PTSG_10816 [Salpingoeca rosetta]